MLDKVMGVFSDPKLVAHLQVLESALTSLEAYSGGGGAMTPGLGGGRIGSSSNRGSFQRHALTMDSTLQGQARAYSNSGPILRSVLMQFEKRAEYVPVFMSLSDVPDSALDAVSFLGEILEIKNRILIKREI
jgi:hypothetical protein